MARAKKVATPMLAEPVETERLVVASVSITEGTPPALTFELRSAIAAYAIVQRRLAGLVGNRSIVGTVGETYVAVALDDVLASNSMTGFDVTLPDGRQV